MAHAPPPAVGDGGPPPVLPPSSQSLSTSDHCPSRDVIRRVPLKSKGLRVVSLNLGGRNTNPLEFELKGDTSERAVRATAMLRRAGKAIVESGHGPRAMLPMERKLVGEILAEVYSGSDGPEQEEEEGEESEWHAFIQRMFQLETWSAVLACIRAKNIHLFNALNLSTLGLGRPSVWEDPASCRAYTDTKEYLLAWKSWYCELDRHSQFWLQEAPRTVKKRGLDATATGFAGLLLFDVMCVCTAQRAINQVGDDAISDDARLVPFKQIANFASQLPASSLTARHGVAQRFLQNVGAHVLFAQEARSFAEQPGIAQDYLPPYCALDGFTAIFLRRDTFEWVRDITAEVASKMESHAGVGGLKKEGHSQKAWHTTTNRLAAVHCQCQAHVGGFRVCLVSLHCSHSDVTASFIEALRSVLSQYPADLNAVGMDSNCAGREATAFQKRLWQAGFEIGCQPRQEQVTCAKQRTYFQTQIKKAGETDISHKDYVVSWGSLHVRRGLTAYTPDLRTAYGVEQDSRQCVRLPTIRWPFDHCGVTTIFAPRGSRTRAALRSRKSLSSCALLCFTAFVLLLPLASPERASPYGPPGSWHFVSWPGTARVGICEAEAGAALCEEEGSSGACYLATPKLPYEEAERFCEQLGASSDGSGGGHLASVRSEEENSFIASKLCPSGELCWIGLQSDPARTRMKWSSGEEVNYTRLVTSPSSFPLFPLSRDGDHQVAVLSSLPAEVSGCSPELLIVGQNLPIYTQTVLLGSGFALLVSAVLLALPRPKHRLTTCYLVIAFCANVGWFHLRVLSLCFADESRFHESTSVLSMYFGNGGHRLTAMFASWVIIKRMSLFYPARAKKVIFWAHLACYSLVACITVLFVDTGIIIDATSPPFLVAFFLMIVIVILYLAFCFLVASDLYQTWVFLQREATTGRSQENNTSLTGQVRAARAYYCATLCAVITGALYWAMNINISWGLSQPTLHIWMNYSIFLVNVLDSVTNDLCAYLLAVLRMGEVVVRAKGITTEVAERARREVEQHRLAVSVLKAAPTSQEQLRHLSQLEGQARSALLEAANEEPYLMLQAAVRIETARIHRLMQCVRARAMTMPVRYQYLIDVPALPSLPRQFVPAQYAAREPSPEAAGEYLDWLFNVADGVQPVLFRQVRQLLTKFNSTPWPSDLGLVHEHFPWTIWPCGPGLSAMQRLNKNQVISPGDILIHSPAGVYVGHVCGRDVCPPARCFVLEEAASVARVHRSGADYAEEVAREELYACNGGGVFIPGPKKQRQRCLNKVASDYEGQAPWPAAANLLDICRCMVVLDDPYALAVFVAHLHRSMRVIRVKNRFSDDDLECISPEELQSLFYAAPDPQEASTTYSSGARHPSQYRDIAINVEVVGPDHVPLVCEIQVTFSNLAILKYADQRLYEIRRMQSPQDLRTTRVFTEAASAESAYC